MVFKVFLERGGGVGSGGTRERLGKRVIDLLFRCQIRSSGIARTYEVKPINNHLFMSITFSIDQAGEGGWDFVGKKCNKTRKKPTRTTKSRGDQK